MCSSNVMQVTTICVLQAQLFCLQELLGPEARHFQLLGPRGPAFPSATCPYQQQYNEIHHQVQLELHHHAHMQLSHLVYTVRNVR